MLQIDFFFGGGGGERGGTWVVFSKSCLLPFLVLESLSLIPTGA